jgi:hypothetical protein
MIMFKRIHLAVAFLTFGLVASVSAATTTLRAEEDKVFLFAHFYTTGESGLHLAWSEDGFRFELLNGGASYLKPQVGESKLMRDPCIYQGPDGRFHLVWTTSWAGQTIGYASSRNLREWTEQKAIPLMAHEPNAKNCWAPELVWDPGKEHFVVFWSTTIMGRFPETEMSNRRPDRNHRIYSATTRDFETFSPVKLHYDGGYNVIDATLVPHGSEWLMFVKDETFAPKTEKNIKLVRAQTIDGPFSKPSAPITGNYWAEGPSALKVGDRWFVYFDKHMENKYGLVTSTDLQSWEDVSERTQFPKDARHGTVIMVPRSLVQELLAASEPTKG